MSDSESRSDTIDSDRTPKDVFESRAPAVEISELQDLLLSDIITEALLSVCSSVWILGSFTNPYKSLDQNSREWSDLDVFIVLNEWEGPQAASNMLMYAPSENVPRGLPEEVEETNWQDTSSLAGAGEWECTIEEAWSNIPGCVKTTIRNASKRGFFRNTEEIEAKSVRSIDVFVGTKKQLKAQMEITVPDDIEYLPGFQIYPEVVAEPAFE